MSKYSVVYDESVLEQALALCRGRYQRDILLGQEALSGATLRGSARNWGDRYARSAQAILSRCQDAGLPVYESTGPHNRRIVVIGDSPDGEVPQSLEESRESYLMERALIHQARQDALRTPPTAVTVEVLDRPISAVLVQ